MSAPAGRALRSILDRRDSLSLNHDAHVRPGRGAGAVDQIHVVQHQHLRRCRTGKQKRQESGHQEQSITGHAIILLMGYMVNLVVEGREALIVGGGEIASRKVEDLLAAKARVTLVAPGVCEKIEALADRIQLHRRPYEPGDIGDAFVVIAATDDEALNAAVSRDCAARNVLVNVVDRPALCTFTVPATVHRGDLTIAIATNGRCPALASILREELEDRYGRSMANWSSDSLSCAAR
jgi:siroheme synthase-like protein